MPFEVAANIDWQGAETPKWKQQSTCTPE